MNQCVNCLELCRLTEEKLYNLRCGVKCKTCCRVYCLLCIDAHVKRHYYEERFDYQYVTVY